MDCKALLTAVQGKEEEKTDEQEPQVAKQLEPMSATKQQLSFRDTKVRQKQVPLVFLLGMGWEQLLVLSVNNVP